MDCGISGTRGDQVSLWGNGGVRHRAAKPLQGALFLGWVMGWDETRWQVTNKIEGLGSGSQPWLPVRITYGALQNRPTWALLDSLWRWGRGHFKSSQGILQLQSSDLKHTQNQQALWLLSIRTPHQLEPPISNMSPPALSESTASATTVTASQT